MSYWQAKSSARFTLEIKKSRFIALAFPCVSREHAMEFLAQAKLDYPDARHHCWAYVLGDPNNATSMAANDDGEPAGTAGKPILSVLSHKQVGDVMLIVVRYFGGIKLGAGGLVRAYAQSADGVVQALKLVKPVHLQHWQASFDFAQEQFLRYWLEQQGGQLVDIEYSQQVQATLLLPQDVTDVEAQLAAQQITASKLDKD